MSMIASASVVNFVIPALCSRQSRINKMLQFNRKPVKFTHFPLA